MPAMENGVGPRFTKLTQRDATTDLQGDAGTKQSHFFFSFFGLDGFGFGLRASFASRISRNCFSRGPIFSWVISQNPPMPAGSQAMIRWLALRSRAGCQLHTRR